MRPAIARLVRTPRRARSRLLLLAAALVAACAPRSAREPGPSTAAATYEVHAVRYGTLPAFPVRSLIAGADSARRLDIALMVWLLRAPGRTVLVDAGFHREKFVQRWKPTDYVKPSDAVAGAGVRPEDVTDIVVTHVHWDHMDGLDLFPRARIWIQRAEYEHHVGADGRALQPAVDREDAEMLARLFTAGRVTLVDGDAREIMPGVTVYTGGKHTFASQYVGVRTRAGTAVIASDNAYLYENLARGLPIAQTLDAASNLAAQARMRTLAADPRLVVPGHDPEVFRRFPMVSARVARIE
jgi:glyoxylase-like metal-dependent hydrolase (beta-lactamase superfamily II)